MTRFWLSRFRMIHLVSLAMTCLMKTHCHRLPLAGHFFELIAPMFLANLRLTYYLAMDRFAFEPLSRRCSRFSPSPIFQCRGSPRRCLRDHFGHDVRLRRLLFVHA